MAFRLYSRSQVFFDNLGQPLAGGSARFYEPGTTTGKDVYSDDDLSVNLGNVETLDSAGRFSTGIWGSGDYRVRFYDADGAEVSDDDPIVDPAGLGLALPSQTGHSGKFLTTNGTTASWYAILASLLPDMTGHSGKYLTNDGTNPSWAQFAATSDTDSITLGSLKLKIGSDTALSSGAHTTSKAVTFGVTFASAPKVFITPNEDTITSSGFMPVFAVTNITTTGCTVHFDVNEAESDSAYNINTSIPFSWFAIGAI